MTRKDQANGRTPDEETIGGAPEIPVEAEAATADAGSEAREQYLRLAADFENFKRRKLQEAADASRYASEDAARALLPVLDNLRRSLEHTPAGESAAVDNFINGIQMVVRDFDAALAGLGVTRIEALGEPFDPAVHEAIGGEESADVDVDTVIAELQPGYRLHDRVLRPALVRVAHPVAAG